MEIAALLCSWELQASMGYNETSLDQEVPELGAPAGTEFPNAPEITASLAVTYSFPGGLS